MLIYLGSSFIPSPSSDGLTTGVVKQILKLIPTVSIGELIKTMILHE
jgi:hypothetical protein